MSELPPTLAEHLRSPHRVGRPAVVDAEGQGSNPACGDDLRIYLTREGTALRLSFQAHSCGAVLATASLVVQALDACTSDELRAFDVQAAVDAAGGLPRHRAHAARVVRRALDAALDQLGA